MGHSIIPPSSAAIWAPAHGCPGWVKMSRKFPETERSEPAERGSAAHELGAEMIQAGARSRIDWPTRAETVGKQASNGIIFDDELFDSATIYAEYMTGFLLERRIFGGQNLGIEAKLRAPTVHEKSHGTVDFFQFSKDLGELIVADFKNGFGVVDVFENWQLLNYAVGVMDELNLWGVEAVGDLRIRFIIVQPNAFHRDGPIRQWLVRDARELRPMIDRLHDGAERALGENPETRSGPHCRYCRARHACPAALAVGPQLYEMVSDVTPLDMSTGELAAYYGFTTRALAHLESLKIAFYEQLKAAARRGETVPGYRVESALGREVWKKSFGEVVRMGGMVGKDLRKQEAITPLQARNKGVDDAVVSAFSTRNPAGVKLVADDNSHARKVFSS